VWPSADRNGFHVGAVLEFPAYSRGGVIDDLEPPPPGNDAGVWG
jgi:hypothetical protein